MGSQMSNVDRSFTSRMQRRYRLQRGATGHRALSSENPSATMIIETYKGRVILAEEDGESWSVRIRDSEFIREHHGEPHVAVAAAKQFIDSHKGVGA